MFSSGAGAGLQNEGFNVVRSLKVCSGQDHLRRANCFVKVYSKVGAIIFLGILDSFIISNVEFNLQLFI